MGWSTTAPTGVAWQSWKDGNNMQSAYYFYRIRSRIGRGSEKNVCVHVQLQAMCYDYDHRGVGVYMKGQVSLGNSSSYVTSSEYSLAVPYGTTTWHTIKDIYYTGTAAKDASCYARGYSAGDGYTDATKHTAPAYTTTYTVSYSKNASDATGSTSSQTKTYGTDLTLRANGFTRSGYTFTGWNTKADGSGTAYAAKGTYKTNAAATLYAQWAPNTFAVSYDGNGSTGGSTEAQTKIYGETLALRENGFEKTGHHFVGWNTAADGSGASYAENGAYSENAAATMYARWEPDAYAVTFDKNADDATGATPAQEKIYGVTLILSGCGFERRGYAFNGWNTAADGTGTSYAAGGSYTANEPVTLYAQWLRLNIPVYVNVGGTVYQVDKAYMNVGGTVRECEVYVNVDGDIIALV